MEKKEIKKTKKNTLGACSTGRRHRFCRVPVGSAQIFADLKKKSSILEKIDYEFKKIRAFIKHL